MFFINFVPCAVGLVDCKIKSYTIEIDSVDIDLVHIPYFLRPVWIKKGQRWPSQVATYISCFFGSHSQFLDTLLGFVSFQNFLYIYWIDGKYWIKRHQCITKSLNKCILKLGLKNWFKNFEEMSVPDQSVAFILSVVQITWMGQFCTFRSHD